VPVKIRVCCNCSVSTWAAWVAGKIKHTQACEKSHASSRHDSHFYWWMKCYRYGRWVLGRRWNVSVVATLSHGVMILDLIWTRDNLSTASWRLALIMQKGHQNVAVALPIQIVLFFEYQISGSPLYHCFTQYCDVVPLRWEERLVNWPPWYPCDAWGTDFPKKFLAIFWGNSWQAPGINAPRKIGVQGAHRSIPLYERG